MSEKIIQRMAGLLIMLLVGSIMLILGFIMWKFRLPGLIAGYDADQVKDPDRLAGWVGKCLMGNGLMAGLLGYVSYTAEAKNAGLVVVMVFTVLSTLSLAVMLAGMQRYLK